MELAKDLAGTAGVLEGSGPAGPVPEDARTGATEVNADAQFPDVHPIWHYGFLFSPALTVGGGTFAIQSKIHGELVLGLPRDPWVDRCTPPATKGSHDRHQTGRASCRENEGQ